MPTDLPALAERLQAATGPDHNLNLAIAKFFREPDAFGNPIPDNAFVHSQSLLGFWQQTSWANGRDWGTVHPYTASIDAALALVERDDTVSWRIILEEAIDEALILKRLPLCIVRRYVAHKMRNAGLIAKEADDWKQY